MRNIKLLAFVFIAALSTSIWAQKTYTFDDGVALATDWTVDKNVPSGGTGKCEIAAPGKFSAKNGNYLLFSFENKSNISITITSTASYNNISNITFDAVANDNSKPNFTLNIVDDSGNVVKNIYSNKTTKTDFNTGGTNKWGVSNSAISPAVSGHVQLILLASSSGKYAAIDNLAVTYQAGPPPASTDATLSALVYGTDQTSVPNFSADQLTYEVELPATYVGGAPSIQGTTTDANATITNVTQATTIPGTASITVTAEDGTTTKTYTVTITRASADPKVPTATRNNIKGTASIDQVNKTITGQVNNGSSLTLAPTFTGNNIDHWTPTDAQDFSTGAKNYVFFSSTTESTQYTVTITEAPAVSTDATLKSLTYGGKSVPNFSPSTLAYNIELAAGIKTPPTIAAETNDSKANAVISQAQSVPGVGKVEVTAEDGTTKLTYTINYTVQVPPSGLTTHVPEIYEAKDIAGGYNTPLTVVGGREYEVFYINRDNSSNLTIATSNTDKAGSICDDTKGSASSAVAKDGWLTISCNGTGGDTNAGAKEEFGASIRSAKFNSSSHVMEMHIQGYDQFSFYGNDNNQDASKNKMFELYIDDVKQTRSPQAYSINRINLSTGEHVIRLTATGGSDSKLCSFSLRLGQEPRTKYLKGNDSNQVVMQTATLKPITYVTKYNNIPGAETVLAWIGAEATGIGLTEIEGSLTDTLVLSGTANCPTGVYKYAVIAKYNGVETSRAEGTFKVASDIKATSDIEVDVYNNEEMDQITFKYYAINAEAVQLSWPNGQPTGISGSGNNGKYIIGGTPTLTGPFPKTFPYTITVTGADTVISGKITVKELNYGSNAVLYLYKNNRAYEQDAVYQHIDNATIDGTKWNLIARKQKEDGLRPQEQYANYKWIMISEDVEANNTEVIQVIRGGANLPVLNLKGFTYATDGLEDITRLGWGEPDNGAIDSAQTKVNGCKIKIEQPTHPVFSKMTGVTKNAEIAILDGYEQHGIMPIRVTKQGTLCLATGYTRSVEDYWGVGELQTAIHEVPADMRGGKKYICLPIARTSVLSAQGNKLVDGIVTYLTSTASSSVEIPKCQITKFTVAGIDGEIDHAAHSIIVNMTVEEFQEADSLKDAEPTIVLADPQNTIVIPDSKELRYAAMGLPKKYTVTDYINQWVYEVSVRLYTPQGIEQTYESGMWVNIFDIYGRKVATTNEDIYTMDLPHGMYIVVTETGATVKIMR